MIVPTGRYNLLPFFPILMPLVHEVGLPTRPASPAPLCCPPARKNLFPQSSWQSLPPLRHSWENKIWFSEAISCHHHPTPTSHTPDSLFHLLWGCPLVQWGLGELDNCSELPSPPLPCQHHLRALRRPPPDPRLHQSWCFVYLRME